MIGTDGVSLTPSREAAKECSPRRKPWESMDENKAPEGRKKPKTRVATLQQFPFTDFSSYTGADLLSRQKVDTTSQVNLSIVLST